MGKKKLYMVRRDITNRSRINELKRFQIEPIEPIERKEQCGGNENHLPTDVSGGHFHIRFHIEPL
jgi:hypothetical protein